MDCGWPNAELVGKLLTVISNTVCIYIKMCGNLICTVYAVQNLLHNSSIHCCIFLLQNLFTILHPKLNISSVHHNAFVTFQGEFVCLSSKVLDAYVKFAYKFFAIRIASVADSAKSILMDTNTWALYSSISDSRTHKQISKALRLPTIHHSAFLFGCF